MEKDMYADFPIVDVNFLLNLSQEFKDNPPLEVEVFFKVALLGYYDAMFSGYTRDAYHIIYNLSNTIPIELRRNMSIYICKDGSIVDEVVTVDSLEDWRGHWRKDNADIPELKPNNWAFNMMEDRFLLR